MLTTLALSVVLATAPQPATPDTIPPGVVPTFAGSGVAAYPGQVPLGRVATAPIGWNGYAAVLPESAVRGSSGRLIAGADLWVADRIRDQRGRERASVDRTAAILRFAALPGTLIAAGALYSAGRLGDRDDLTEIGLHSGQAVVAAGVATLAGKVLVGRARPRASPLDPGDVRLGRGLRGDLYQSFPSAHTAAAFAAATVAGREVGGRAGGGSSWLYAVFYGGAALTGISRIYHEEHWASDIVGGALIGTAAGWQTLEFHDRRSAE